MHHTLIPIDDCAGQTFYWIRIDNEGWLRTEQVQHIPGVSIKDCDLLGHFMSSDMQHAQRVLEEMNYNS